MLYEVITLKGLPVSEADRHSIAMTLVICVLVTLQAYVIGWMLP